MESKLTNVQILHLHSHNLRSLIRNEKKIYTADPSNIDLKVIKIILIWRSIKIPYTQIEKTNKKKMQIHTRTFIFLLFCKTFWSPVYMQKNYDTQHIRSASLSPFHRLADQFRALLLPLGNSVTLTKQIVVYFVCDDAVVLVLWMLGNKFPHPLCHGHQFSWG